jgi:Arc/MetJ-type ribon-helix-helix transcriptional regulator
VDKSVLRESKVTVKIPRPLYRKIQLVIENSGFSSPTDFIVFVLRDLLGDAERKGHAVTASGAPAIAPPPGSTAAAHAAEAVEEFSASDLEAMKQKLKNLGYL